MGYLKLKIGNAQTELKDINALEVERIYVLKVFHGKKVAQLLDQKALTMKAPYIELEGWEVNTKAIYFYTKNGFETFDQYIFILGNDQQVDIMMKLDLNRSL